MSSYNVQLKNGPGDKLYPIVRNLRAELPDPAAEYSGDVVLYLGNTYYKDNGVVYYTGHTYQCRTVDGEWQWVDVGGELTTTLMYNDIAPVDHIIYMQTLPSGGLYAYNFTTPNNTVNFGLRITQPATPGALALTCNNSPVWWGDGNNPPKFDTNNIAPAISEPETTYMFRFHWDGNVRALLGNLEYKHPAYNIMAPISGTRGVFIQSGTTVVSSGMTLYRNVSAGQSAFVYNLGLLQNSWIVGSGAKPASVDVSSGGTLASCHISRRVSSGYGHIKVYNGGYAINNEVYEAQNFVVYSGGYAAKTHLVAGDATLHVSSGGVAAGVTLRTGASVRVQIHDSGRVTNLHMQTGTTTVLSGGTLTSAYTSGGRLVIDEGGMASSAVVYSTASASVSSGGSFDFLVVSGGTATIEGEGSELDVTDGGVATLTGNASTMFAYVRSGGTVIVDASAQLSYPSLDSGASAVIYGYAEEVWMSPGGTVNGITVATDYSIPTMVSGSGYVDMGLGIYANSAVVGEDGDVSGLQIQSGSVLLVSNGGIVSDTIVSSGASMHVYAGGSDVNTTVLQGGLYMNDN